MKKKLTLKQELKKIVNAKVLKTKIILNIQKKGYQLSKNNFLLDKLNKKTLKFPLFYKKLKEDFNFFSSNLTASTPIIFTPYIIIEKTKLLKNSCITTIATITKINELLN